MTLCVLWSRCTRISTTPTDTARCHSEPVELLGHPKARGKAEWNLGGLRSGWQMVNAFVSFLPKNNKKREGWWRPFSLSKWSSLRYEITFSGLHLRNLFDSNSILLCKGKVNTHFFYFERTTATIFSLLQTHSFWRFGACKNCPHKVLCHEHRGCYVRHWYKTVIALWLGWA